MEKDSNSFFEWYLQATEEEKRLVGKVWEFGDFFDDMLFQKGSCTYDLLKIQTKDGDSWKEDVYSLPDELEYFEYEWFRYNLTPPEGSDGCFDKSTLTFSVLPEAIDNGNTVLHEMIHLHEYVINDLPMFFHDMVFWALYSKLKTHIPKLDEIVTDHAHVLTGATLHATGGTHDILFLLKSFDLDIRMGYPLGTIFSYGREDLFKGYSYTK